MSENSNPLVPVEQVQAPSAFPSIGSLFKESWVSFKKSWVYLLAFYGIVFGVSLVIYGIFIGILILFGVGAALSASALSKGGGPLALIGMLSAFGIFIPVFVGLMIFISSVAQAGMILIVNKYKREISFGEVLKKSIGLAIPLFLVNLLLFVVGVGGFFMFVIPGLVFGLFFVFAAYEAVLENKKWVGALRSSMAIVTSNFGDIFVRMLLLFVIMFAIGIALSIVRFAITLPFMLIKDSGVSAVINMGIGLLFWPIQIALSWFSVAYINSLYNQAKQAANPNKKSSLMWVWIITAVGWIFAILAVIAVSAAIMSLSKSGALEQMFNPAKTSTTKGKPLSQFEAQILAGETFIKLNEYRVKNKLLAIEEDQKLCTYAQRRLDAFAVYGDYDSGKGFYEDSADTKIVNAYFDQYSNWNESFYPTTVFVSPVVDSDSTSIINNWSAPSKDGKIRAIADGLYTNGCINANSRDLILIIAAKKSVGTNTQAPQYNYQYATPTPFPTVVPGQPGSKEWQAQWQAQWDAMQKK